MNDAKNVRRFLTSESFLFPIIRSPIYTTSPAENWNFKPEDIFVLTDDTRDVKRLPTKANMLGAMKWLVKDAKANDSLFFHCK